MRKKVGIISIGLYLLAGLLFIYSIWAFVHCLRYIKAAISLGQLTAEGNEYDIVNFYMSNCAQYMVFAVLLFGIGWLLYKQTPILSMPVHTEEPANYITSHKEDEELDEWFQKMRQDKE